MNPKFNQYMAQAGVTLESLPPEIARMITAFEQSLNLFMAADSREQTKWLPVLQQADAVISASIYKTFQAKIDLSRQEKINQMALRAQALKARWNKS